jgi:uncharacterized protein
MRVGVLSDTHGRLRPKVLALLAGCDRILHAGDVGGAGGKREPAAEVLARLREIAPLSAVRGNWDNGPGARDLPPVLEGDLAGLAFGMVHRQEDVPADWPRRHRLVIFGHSHRPELTWRGACLLLNPGACGPRRFHLPLTLAILTVAAGPRIVPEILAVE